jgi:hypothetical protein
VQFTNTERSTNQPLYFLTVPSQAEMLMNVYAMFKKESDEYTQIPAYTYGMDEARGAGSTASGLAMLMSSAAKGIRRAIGNVDRDIIKPTIYRHFVHLMLYDDDESIKGDVVVHAKGALSLVLADQTRIARREFLDRTNNPVDMSIIGPDGRATVLREDAKTLGVPVDDVVPSRADMMARVEAMAAMSMTASQSQKQITGGN